MTGAQGMVQTSYIVINSTTMTIRKPFSVIFRSNKTNRIGYPSHAHLSFPLNSCRHVPPYLFGSNSQSISLLLNSRNRFAKSQRRQLRPLLLLLPPPRCTSLFPPLFTHSDNWEAFQENQTEMRAKMLQSELRPPFPLCPLPLSRCHIEQTQTQQHWRLDI